jgi:hypothetical protein
MPRKILIYKRCQLAYSFIVTHLTEFIEIANSQLKVIFVKYFVGANQRSLAVVAKGHGRFWTIQFLD